MSGIPMIEYRGDIKQVGDAIHWMAEVSYEGTITNGGQTYQGAMTDPLLFAVEKDSNVTITLRVNDDNDNVSDPTVVNFVAIDDVKPDAPVFESLHSIREFEAQD